MSYVSATPGLRFATTQRGVVTPDTVEVSFWDAEMASVHSTLVLPGGTLPYAVTPSLSRFETPGLSKGDMGDRVAVAIAPLTEGAVATIVVAHVNSGRVEWCVPVDLNASTPSPSQPSSSPRTPAMAQQKARPRAGGDRVKELFMLDAESLLILMANGCAFVAQRSAIPTKLSKLQELEDNSDDDDGDDDDDDIAATEDALKKRAAAAAVPAGGAAKGKSSQKVLPQFAAVTVMVKRWLPDVDNIVALYAASPDVIIAVTCSGQLLTASLVDQEVLDKKPIANFAKLSVTDPTKTVKVAGEPLLHDSGACGGVIIASAATVLHVDVATGRSSLMLEGVKVAGLEYQSEFTAVVAGEHELRYFTLTKDASGATTVDAHDPIEFRFGQRVVHAGFSDSVDVHTIVLLVDDGFVTASLSNETGVPTQRAVDGAGWIPMRNHSVSGGDGVKRAMRHAYVFAPSGAVEDGLFIYEVVSRSDVHTRAGRNKSAAPLLLALMKNCVALRRSDDAGLRRVVTTAWNPITFRRAARCLVASEAQALFNAIVQLLEVAATSSTTSPPLLSVVTSGVEAAVQIVTLQHQMGFALPLDRVRVLYTSIVAIRALGKRWSSIGARLDGLFRFEQAALAERDVRDAEGEGHDAAEAAAVAGLRAAERLRTIRRENTNFKNKYAVGGGSVDTSIATLLSELPASLRAPDAVLGASAGGNRGWLAVVDAEKHHQERQGSQRFAEYESMFMWQPQTQ